MMRVDVRHVLLDITCSLCKNSKRHPDTLFYPAVIPKRSPMKISFLITNMMVTVLCAGCGTRSLYDGLRIQQEMQCQKLERSDQQDCVKRSGMSYDEYQQHKKKQKKER